MAKRSAAEALPDGGAESKRATAPEVSTGDVSKFFDALIDVLRSEGGYWNPKLTRGSVPPLHVPGVVATEPIAEGEMLVSVPAHVHLTADTLREAMPRLCEACDALPSSSSDRRSEAAQVAAMTMFLSMAKNRAGGGPMDPPSDGGCPVGAAPTLWHRSADCLLHGVCPGLDAGHPFSRWRREPGSLSAVLEPSAEAEHIRAQANYVGVVYNCLVERLSSDLLGPGFDEETFFQAWMCMVSRKFSSPRGSAFVPAVDLFNHAPCPGSEGGWDEGEKGVVVRARRHHKAGEEICISYGDLSNPLLLRTYGFTVEPAEEPVWSCTFEEHALYEACREGGPAGLDLAENFASLPNLHLDAAFVTETVAAALEVCALGGGAPGLLLWELCQERLDALAADPSVAVLAAALETARGAGGDSASEGAWWSQAELGHLSRWQLDALRVKMSEYMCLTVHLEALEALKVGSLKRSPVGPPLVRGRGLREDLAALHRAGILDQQPKHNAAAGT